jgi:hypothetical protein
MMNVVSMTQQTPDTACPHCGHNMSAIVWANVTGYSDAWISINRHHQYFNGCLWNGFPIKVSWETFLEPGFTGTEPIRYERA